MDEYEAEPAALKEFEKLCCSILDRIRDIKASDLSLRSKGVIIKQMASVSKKLADKRKKSERK